MAGTIWGVALAGIGTYIAIPAAAVKGTIDALNGKSFSEGFNEAGVKIVDAFAEFGDNHAEKLTDITVRKAAEAAADYIRDRLKDSPPNI